VAKSKGEGVRRTWLVSIDSLQAFRDARQSAGNLPRTDRAAVRDAHIAAEGFGNPIRELADRLAEEAARAAEYRVRLELTEQAQTSLEEELATERRRREEAERERDELRELRELREELRQRVEVPSEPQEATEKGSEETTKGEEVTEAAQEPQKPSQRRERSWWRAFFGLE
jgi:chromosome segregation ATPase